MILVLGKYGVSDSWNEYTLYDSVGPFVGKSHAFVLVSDTHHVSWQR